MPEQSPLAHILELENSLADKGVEKYVKKQKLNKARYTMKRRKVIEFRPKKDRPSFKPTAVKLPPKKVTPLPKPVVTFSTPLRPIPVIGYRPPEPPPIPKPKKKIDFAKLQAEALESERRWKQGLL